MSNNNHGSPRPVNWKPAAFVETTVVKSTSHTSLREAHARQGTPITIRGAVNGQLSKLTLPNPPELSPDLYLGDVNKALLEGASVAAPEPEESVAQGEQSGEQVAVGKRGGKIVGFTDTGRKIYAPSVKQTKKAMSKNMDNVFAKALGTPGVPLRPEQQQQMQQPPGMPPQGQPQQGQPPGQMQGMQPQGAQGQPKIPGFNQAVSASMQPQGGQGQPQQDQQLGQSPNGQPIMQDPFHPSHQQFGKEDHDAAAGQHAANGNNQAAQAHEMMGKDAQSPMDRAADKFGTQNQQPGGAPQANQGKPNFGQQGPDRNGPKPGMHEQQGAQSAPPGAGQPQPGQSPMGQQPGMGQPQGGPQEILKLLDTLKQMVTNQVMGVSNQPVPSLASPKPPMMGGMPQPGMPGQPPQGAQGPHGAPPTNAASGSGGTPAAGGAHPGAQGAPGQDGQQQSNNGAKTVMHQGGAGGSGQQDEQNDPQVSEDGGENTKIGPRGGKIMAETSTGHPLYSSWVKEHHSLPNAPKQNGAAAPQTNAGHQNNEQQQPQARKSVTIFDKLGWK